MKPEPPKAPDNAFTDTSFVHLTQTGVPDDAQNAWQALGFILGRMRMQLKKAAPDAAALESARKSLNTPVQTTTAYMQEYYSPDFRGQIADQLNAQTVAALDALAAEFNALALKDAVTYEIAQQFLDRVQVLFNGAAPERATR